MVWKHDFSDNHNYESTKIFMSLMTLQSKYEEAAPILVEILRPAYNVFHL